MWPSSSWLQWRAVLYPHCPCKSKVGMDGNCSTWQVNCCHLVDELKTATKAWTRNKKKKCPQTYEDQESLGSKSGRISFLKCFYLNVIFGTHMFNFLHEFNRLKSNRGFWPSNDYPAQGCLMIWYAANILSNSTAFDETNHIKNASVFVLCNMCEMEH